MGKRKKQPMGLSVGRYGNTVVYLLNGQLISRTIGVVDHFSDAQLQVQQKVALTTFFLNPLKEFIRTSFNAAAKDQTWSNYNLASSVNNKRAITGKYPDMELSFANALVAMGDMPEPLNPSVKLNGRALDFTWEADLESEGTNASDQVMLVVYLPQQAKALTVSSGEKRTAEHHRLPLTTLKHGAVLESYIAFVSADRRSVSNSVYLGQIIWTDQSKNHGNKKI